MSARDAQRALLDALLGEERDKPPEEHVGPVHFSHPSVDKHLLVGCSPRELLKGTRFAPTAPPQTLNPPNATHLREWNALSREEKNEYGYEYELLQVLRRLVRDCDQRIHTLEARLAREEQDKTIDALSRDAQIIMNSEEQFQSLQNRVKAQAMAGNLADALRVAQDLRALDESRNAALMASVTPPKQVVCKVSGNLMALIDTDERVLAHYEGRAFYGWGVIRKKVVELERLNLPAPGMGRRAAAPPGERRRGGRSRSPPQYRRGRSRSGRR